MPLDPKRLRHWFAAAALSVLAVSLAYYLYGRLRAGRNLERASASLGIEIQQSTQGFTLSKSEAGRTIFTVHASKALQYKQGGRAELRLADDRAMHRGDVATLTPPGDIHNHGHVLGTGPSPYSLILLGDDMYLFDREEYDPGQETWRKLAPGDPGQSHR